MTIYEVWHLWDTDCTKVDQPGRKDKLFISLESAKKHVNEESEAMSYLIFWLDDYHAIAARLDNGINFELFTIVRVEVSE
jgi:hypothetical protein